MGALDSGCAPFSRSATSLHHTPDATAATTLDLQQAIRENAQRVRTIMKQRRAAVHVAALAEINASGRECCICLNTDAGVATTMRALSCSHSFHEECLLKWWQTSSGLSCPVCRHQH
mmetsp:Transcript_5989/g.14324  ORF Transcript_5989/g.14324 Transcript_5989/m.14324 type:complete len:117 (+) Transcript_5989:73-423(+)